MIPASVGFHCPECAKAGAQKVVRAGSLVTRPLVTSVLIGLNVLVFVLTRGSGTEGGAWAFQFLGLDRQSLIDFGLFEAAVAHGEWYRIVTSGFLHADLLHIGFNMWFLWLLGGQLEPAVGRLRFGLIYVVGLMGGSFGVILVTTNELTVGASGAVFGLMGAAIAAQRASGVNPWDTGLGGLLMLNLIFTFAIPGISIGGHLGGLAGGYLAGLIIWELGPRSRPQWLPTNLVAGLAVVLGLVAIALSESGFV